MKTYIRVLRARWRQKSTGVDMERNYITVTLCGEYAVKQSVNFFTLPAYYAVQGVM